MCPLPIKVFSYDLPKCFSHLELFDLRSIFDALDDEPLRLSQISSRIAPCHTVRLRPERLLTELPYFTIDIPQHVRATIVSSKKLVAKDLGLRLKETLPDEASPQQYTRKRPCCANSLYRKKEYMLRVRVGLVPHQHPACDAVAQPQLRRDSKSGIWSVRLNLCQHATRDSCLPSTAHMLTDRYSLPGGRQSYCP